MLKQLSLRWKMVLSYAIPLLILLAIVGINQVKMNAAVEKSNALNDSAYLTPDILKINENITRMQRSSYAYILSGGNQSSGSSYSRRIYQDSSVSIETTFAKLDKGAYSPAFVADLNKLRGIYNAVKESNGQLVKLVDDGKVKEAMEAFTLGNSVRIAQDGDSLADDTAKFDLASRDRLREMVTEDIKSAKNVVVFGTLAAIVLLMGFGILVSLYLSRDISTNASQVSTTATSIAATLEQHEKAVTQQGSSVSETTSTVEELVSSARLSSEQADSAATSARAAQETTARGLELVTRNQADVLFLEEKMSAIAKQIMGLSDQAAQIGGISKLVGELAGETNMLALNAAVEAARAGEHGKGFAVVASEIRKLADQSKQSADRATQIVADIQKSTNSMVMIAEEGTKTTHQVSDSVQQTSKAFENLGQLSEGVYQNAQQVLLNSKQQAAALIQINEAMQNINNGSREMISGTSQARIGIDALTKVADHMRTMV